jgi:hypothetical protein
MQFEITTLGREYINNPPRGGVAPWIKPTANFPDGEAGPGPFARADTLWARTGRVVVMNRCERSML